jgi:hypothetical protein
VVSCVTYPHLSSCIKAAVTVALVVATAGEGEVEVAAMNAAEEAGTRAAEAGVTAAADGGTAQIFRTVGSAEARDITESGVYRNPEGLEGKYFFPTRAQAENLGAKYAKMGLGEQTITSGRIGTDVLRQFGEPVEAAGEGPAFFLRNESLRHITNVTIEGPLR